MNMNESKASHVLGAKSARPCDSCLIKRARWFCAADDAFLCQSCDVAVHSANQLACRHQRVRLEASSCKGKSSPPPPAWFTKKTRTPRPAKVPYLPLVPEMGSEEAFPDENGEQLFCRVPVFDPFADEFCAVFDDDQQACPELNLEELLGHCDAELAEFAADVESLLGADSATGVVDGIDDGKRVKIEEDEDEVGAVIASHLDPALDVKMNWEFDSVIVESREKAVETKRTTLRLDYEAVIAAWAPQGCPWTDGIRPQFDIDEFMGECLGGSCGRKWAGREARVSRYREKRRTRLFSKKIRYEVRKLNAEKRPRMKGRFVKRTTPFLGSS